MSRRNSSLRLFALSAAVSCALVAGTASSAERINVSGLASGESVDGLIVTYRQGSAPRRDKALMMRRIGASAASVTGHAKSSGLRHERTLGIGADLINLGRQFSAKEAAAMMRQIAADPDVAYVEPNIRLYPTLTPNDPSFPSQYGFQSGVGGSNADQAWNTGFIGAGKIVAVIDTGYRPHADLNANVINGYDFITNVTTANDGDGRDASALDPGDWVAAGFCGVGQPARNSSWHGTHVSGTVAAVTNNATGVAGMAHQGKVLAVRALGRCGGTLADIADAITWSSGGTVSGVPAVGTNKASVINMSLGGASTCTAASAIQVAINGAISRGTTVVVAAGNSNANVSGFTPAGCTGAGLIVVGATDSAGAKASFSNYGAGVDVSAPGVGILSTLNSGTSTPVADNYVSYNGTSMASPHVAGLVAMMHSKPSADCTPANCESIVKANTKAFGVAPPQPMGTGIIDALKTINATP